MNDKINIYVGVLVAAWVMLLVAVVGTTIGAAVHSVGNAATAALTEPEPAGQTQTARIGAIVGLVNKVSIGQSQTAAQPEPELESDGGKWSLPNVLLLAVLIACVDGAILIFARPREG